MERLEEVEEVEEEEEEEEVVDDDRPNGNGSANCGPPGGAF